MSRRYFLPLPLFLAIGCGDKDDGTDDTSVSTDDTAVDDTGAPDQDGDGWSAPDDCDDTDPLVNPDADEVCDGIDNDCSGLADDDAVDATLYYGDQDRDGYGAPDSGSLECEQPPDTTTTGDDCDDDNGDVYPGALEICQDGVVNDCDGTLEDARDACPLSWPTDVNPADAIWGGEGLRGNAGFVLAGGADADGDGLDDVLVGAPHQSNNEGFDGSAYLLLGGTSGSGGLAAKAAATFEGQSNGYLGYSAALVDDWNGDGQAEVVAGEPHNEGGAVYVFLSPHNNTYTINNADARLNGSGNDFAGNAVDAGDVNGDGVEDLLVGALTGTYSETSAGQVHLVLGPVSGTSALTSHATYTTFLTNANIGRAVSTGDLDGDGVDDMLIGASGANYNELTAVGAAVVVLGGTNPQGQDLSQNYDAVVTGSEGYARLGHSVDIVQDVDGDGLDDIAVGQPYAGEQSEGAAYVFLSLTTDQDTDDADVTITGGDAGGWVGWDLDSAGDADGDGLGDLLLGAPSDVETGTGQGSAYLVLGGTTGTLDLADVSVQTRGADNGDNLGTAVLGQDVDGDGRPDALLGARYGDAGGQTDAGEVVLLINGSGI